MGKRRGFVDRCATKCGAERAIADEDKQALLITESLAALKQHLAMHAATLTSYEQDRAVVVSYLQAKRVWIPIATYAAGSTTRRNDPNAMEIGNVGGKKGKEKGKGLGNEKGKTKSKRRKRKGWQTRRKERQGKRNDKEKCASCWRAHSTQDCLYNAKGQGTLKRKGQKSVQAINDETASTVATSAGPSASQAGSTAPSAESAIRPVNDAHNITHVHTEKQPAKQERAHVG